MAQPETAIAMVDSPGNMLSCHVLSSAHGHYAYDVLESGAAVRQDQGDRKADLPLDHAGHGSEALHETKSASCLPCCGACPLSLTRLLLGSRSALSPPSMLAASTLGRRALCSLLAIYSTGLCGRSGLLSCISHLGACLGCSIFELLSIPLHLSTIQTRQSEIRFFT